MWNTTGTLQGIVFDFWKEALNLLKMTAEFIIIVFPKESVVKLRRTILTNGSCDIFGNGNPLEGSYDMTHPYFFDSLVWVVKTPKEIPRWRYAFEIYSKEIWVIWFLAAAALSSAQFTLLKIQKNDVELTDGLVLIFFIFMQQSQRVKLSSLSQYILLGILILTTFLMNLFYCTKFAFLLTGFKYETSVDTFENIIEEGYTLEFSKAFLIFLQTHKSFNFIKNHHVESLLFLNITEDKRATLFLRNMFNYQIGNFLDDQNRPLVRMLQEPLVTLPFMAILRRGSSLTNKISEKFDRLMENGILSKIIEEYDNHKMNKGPTVILRKLTLQSLQLAFILWVIGVVVCFARFYFELKN